MSALGNIAIEGISPMVEQIKDYLYGTNQFIKENVFNSHVFDSEEIKQINLLLFEVWR